MLHPKAIEKRAVQESNTDLQQGVRARRTPAHLLFLAHPVIDQMVHDRFNMRRGDPAPGGPCLRKARHAAAVTAHIALEFVDCAGDAGEGVGSYAGMFRCPAFDVATQTRELQKCPPRPTAPKYISDPGNPPPQWLQLVRVSQEFGVGHRQADGLTQTLESHTDVKPIELRLHLLSQRGLHKVAQAVITVAHHPDGLAAPDAQLMQDPGKLVAAPARRSGDERKAFSELAVAFNTTTRDLDLPRCIALTVANMGVVYLSCQESRFLFGTAANPP